MVRPSTVTLREVAKSAAVHVSTASRAINPETRYLVNDETVRRVLAAAEQLGYQPNSLARGLKLNRTFTIGVVIPDLTNPVFPPIIRGLEDDLGVVGYTVILGNTDNDAERERSVLEAMSRRRVDGLVLATARRDYPVLADLRDAGVPVVLINRGTDDATVPTVTGDDHAGVGLALRHLAALGHERIAYVAGSQTVSTGFARYQGFVSWMSALGLELDPDRVVFADWFREDAGAQAFRMLLDRRDDFTAVVAGNDLIALGCYDVASERDIAVPADLSVVGYNDIPFSDKFSPPLTTIRVPLYEVGRQATQLLLDLLDEDRDDGVASVRLTPTLVERSSTAPPRR